MVMNDKLEAWLVIREAHPEEVAFYSFSYLLSISRRLGPNACPPGAHVLTGETDKKCVNMEVQVMASERDKSWKKYKGNWPGHSWSPRGQGGLSGEVGPLGGSPRPGVQVPRPTSLVEEELRNPHDSRKSGIWDIFPNPVTGHGIVKSVCVPRQLQGTRLSRPPDSTCTVCPKCGLVLPQETL